ncbi:MAG: AAA family ATPase [Planctomycetes bacterium]|nr:AAA family ATPase [Planctomycetota bacterium]
MVATGASLPDKTRKTFELPLKLVGGLAAEEADRRVAMAVRAGDVGARSLAFYLADFADRGVYQQLGFHSVELYAETRYHIRPSTTRQYVATGRALLELPGIDRAFRRGGLFWSQVRELIRVATPETEDEWVEFAKGRTARQIAAEVARRRKGERPADRRRRRIHETWFRPQGRMNAAQWAKWTTAREKLEAELDRPVTDAEMLEEAANLLLGSRPDGSVAGRTPVNDSHYKTYVLHDISNEITTIKIDGVRLPLDVATARIVLRSSDRPELAGPATESDPENDPEDTDDPHENHEQQAPETPFEWRHEKTPEKLRRRVLRRDRHRCRCCGSRSNLTAHHKKWRRYGGRTVAKNLVTLCEHCHSLVHAGLLVIRGTLADGLHFVDAKGRELGALDPPVREAVEATALELDARASHPGPGKKHDARASGLDEVVGQRTIVRNLQRAVRAAMGRGEPLGHVLLCGPPGLGKTRFATAVAADLGRPCRVLHAPFVTEPAELAREAAEVPAGGVLFIDEVHRLPLRVAESLYLVMDSRRITVIGATTDSGMLPGAYLSRFALREDLRYYSADELVEILNRSAAGLGVTLDDDAAVVIAGASRDTPREALALLEAVRDEVQLRGTAAIDAATVLEVLRSRDIDERGTTRIDREILEALNQARGPLGLTTLADRIGVSRRDLLRVHEPFLVRRGLITRTRRGRVLNS